MTSNTLNPFCSLTRASDLSTRAPGAAGTTAAIGLTGQADAAAAETPPVFHTVEAVARALGVSPKTIHRRIRDGVIRKVAMGGRLVRISSAELRRLAADAPFRTPGLTDEVSMPYQILGLG
jgi:excisionase family DNA binding protein